MIHLGMDIMKIAVDIHNREQVPIIIANQPLYTLCKQIHWSWPDCYSEEHFTGLHIEINAHKMLGDLLDSSRWTNALTKANVASSD